jgi:predicted AlkP superfamily phosphohydrolase/phosphomutase
MSNHSPHSPLVILGFDAGDPNLLQSWAQAGYLPTLASIMRRGVWTKTKGSELALEHGVWQSVFSGLSRGQHGCYYLRQLKPGSYDLEIVHGCDVDAPPFWARWRDHSKRVVAVDIHDVPPVAGVPGLQLGNWAIHRGWLSRAPAEQPSTEPFDLLEEVRRRFGPPTQIIEAPGADQQHNRRIFRDLLRRVEKKGALCRFLLEREKPDAVVICFGESHTVGHQFWRYRAEASPRVSANGDEFAHAIRNVYQAIDREMGLLLARLPHRANVFVLSSVGLADHYPTGDLLTSFCRQLGYQVPKESNHVPLHPAALARKIVPENWRVALSRRLPRETREGLLSRQFRNSTDWQKTTAFALPSYYTGFVRINLRGREPQGVVEPGTDYEALLQRLETDLSKLIDTKTGQPAIDHVVRTAEVYGCNPPTVLPDLIVHWKSCRHFVDRVLHPKAVLTQQKPEFFRDTDHAEHGFVAAAGPAIRSDGEIAEVEALDLAPTFLSLLNETASPDLTGKVAEHFLCGTK